MMNSIKYILPYKIDCQWALMYDAGAQSPVLWDLHKRWDEGKVEEKGLRGRGHVCT